MDEKTRERKKMRIVIIVLSIMLAIAVAFVIWELCFREKNKTIVLSPDYAPVDKEKNAVPLDDSDATKVENPKDGGGVGIEYTKSITINVKNRYAELYFANPRRSNQDMIVQLVVHDKVIIQSGRLTPGNAVTRLELLPDVNIKLEEGTYDGKYVIYFYQQNTGEKAILNTEIPVVVTVTK